MDGGPRCTVIHFKSSIPYHTTHSIVFQRYNLTHQHTRHLSSREQWWMAETNVMAKCCAPINEFKNTALHLNEICAPFDISPNNLSHFSLLRFSDNAWGPGWLAVYPLFLMPLATHWSPQLKANNHTETPDWILGILGPTQANETGEITLGEQWWFRLVTTSVSYGPTRIYSEPAQLNKQNIQLPRTLSTSGLPKQSCFCFQ